MTAVHAAELAIGSGLLTLGGLYGWWRSLPAPMPRRTPLADAVQAWLADTTAANARRTTASDLEGTS